MNFKIQHINAENYEFKYQISKIIDINFLKFYYGYSTLRNTTFINKKKILGDL